MVGKAFIDEGISNSLLMSRAIGLIRFLVVNIIEVAWTSSVRIDTGVSLMRNFNNESS